MCVYIIRQIRDILLHLSIALTHTNIHIICALVTSPSLAGISAEYIWQCSNKIDERSEKNRDRVCPGKIMRIHLLRNILLSNFQSTRLNFKMLSVCFSLLPSCEILSGKHVRILVSGGLFPRESQLSSLVQRRLIGWASRWGCGHAVPLNTPFWSSFSPHFFPSHVPK